jgi:excisionase family DNA binding protein
MPRLLVPVEEAAAALSVGRTAFYRLLRSGEIASLMIGHQRRVPIASIEAYVARQTARPAPISALWRGWNGDAHARAQGSFDEEAR